MNNIMSGAQIVVEALLEQKVDTVFGYPGGAVLPIYDEIFKQSKIKHQCILNSQHTTVPN